MIGLQEFNFEAFKLGCEVSIAVIADTGSGADDEEIKNRIEQDVQECFELLDNYEKRFSRFLEDSELTQVNKSAGGVVQISDEFMHILLLARELYTETGGVFNPLLRVARLGYNKPFQELVDVSGGLVEQDDYSVDFDTVEINEDARSVRLQGGHALDFGGFLKGYLAEYIAQKLSSNYVGVIVNIGGDIFVHGVEITGDSISISIYNPTTDMNDVHVAVQNKALATSGVYKRKWIRGGSEYHHILSSKTKKSAKTDILSASVLHTNGARADAYATVAVSLGSEEAQEFLEEKQCVYVLVKSDGTSISNI